MSLRDRIENDFTYHPPRNDEEIAKYQLIRSTAKALAHLINENVPDGREKSTALTNLDQAVFWSNAGIARNGDGE